MADQQLNGTQDSNPLFPIFLKLDELDTLIVGGGYVGLEKVSGILRNSPHAKLTLVAGTIREEIKDLASRHSSLKLVCRNFEDQDLEDRDLVIVGTNDKELNKEIKRKAKNLKILTNVADTPDQCDFYLASVITKGDLKVAISTNGKSPTLAKRFREMLEEVLPDTVPELLNNMREIRDTLKGDFEYKLKALNDLTANMVGKKKES